MKRRSHLNLQEAKKQKEVKEVAEVLVVIGVIEVLVETEEVVVKKDKLGREYIIDQIKKRDPKQQIQKNKRIINKKNKRTPKLKRRNQMKKFNQKKKKLK